MKQLLTYLKEYLSDHYHPKLFVSLGLFLLLAISFNYWLDFEDQYVDSFRREWLHVPAMALFQGFPFLVICGIIHYLDGSPGWFREREFWLKALFGFLVLGWDRSYFTPTEWLSELSFYERHFTSKVLYWGSTLVTTVIPLLLFHRYFEKGNAFIYGLNTKKNDLKPYLILLSITAVFIIGGSFFSDIQDYYPRYKHSFGGALAEDRSWPEAISIGFYEGAYGLSFLGVEMFFRGFLILGFYRIVGPKVVLAMVASYAFLHFGKPLTETVSSIFGGFILGVLVLRTKNIWGGVLIHVGVAWLMELMGYLQGIAK